MFTKLFSYLNLSGLYARAATPITRPTSIACTRYFHNVVGDIVSPSHVRGIDNMGDARLNKGLAFTQEERQVLGIYGLSPPRYKTQEEQVALCKIAVNRYAQPLNKYLYLIDLQDRNERLFFRFLSENIVELMPIVYTPTVGLACQRFGLLYRKPRGVFVCYHDRGHIFNVLKNWAEPNVRAICVTDGERILGLGDLGSNGMGIPVGKLSLYTALAGVKPHQCLPVMLDVGTDNQDLLEDPLYVGLRQRRVRSHEYLEFMDEFMEAVKQRWGPNTLVQFEDFGAHNAFGLLNRYRHSYCVFNDDLQGTGAMTLAGLYAATRVTNKDLVKCKFLFAGAGGAGIGIAQMIVRALISGGVPKEKAIKSIYMMDADGLLTKSRKNLVGNQVEFAKDMEPIAKIEDIVAKIQPQVLIGVSASTGLFSEAVLRQMAAINERPIVFALSNPTSKAECTAQQAYEHTEARVLFASGSPFPPVQMGGKTYYPGQGNNSYIFPGVALGIICTETHHVPDNMFLIAAKELADCVEQSDLDKGALYPPLTNIREVSMRIATKVTACAYDMGLASTYPEPKDKRKFLEKYVYTTNYEPALPVTWEWPPIPEIKTRPLEPAMLNEDEKKIESEAVEPGHTNSKITAAPPTTTAELNTTSAPTPPTTETPSDTPKKAPKSPTETSAKGPPKRKK